MDVKDINLNDYEISPQADKDIIVLRKKKSKYPKWEDLGEIRGYHIYPDSSIGALTEAYRTSRGNGNVFLTEKHAKSALAIAQISQLIPYYGGEITNDEWKDSSIRKYIIFRKMSYVGRCEAYSNYEFLAFHTAEQRDEFLKNNEQLVKDYLMIE
jgi:hypothetical protein